MNLKTSIDMNVETVHATVKIRDKASINMDRAREIANIANEITESVRTLLTSNPLSLKNFPNTKLNSKYRHDTTADRKSQSCIGDKCFKLATYEDVKEKKRRQRIDRDGLIERGMLL